MCRKLFRILSSESCVLKHKFHASWHKCSFCGWCENGWSVGGGVPASIWSPNLMFLVSFVRFWHTKKRLCMCMMDVGDMSLVK